MEEEHVEGGNETLDEYGGFTAHYDVFPIILAMLIVLANGTALVLFARSKKLRSVTNGVLASLAASDFLAGFIGIPLYLVCNVAYDIPWCLSSAVFWRFVSVSTVLHLGVLTLHLYASVVHGTCFEALLKRSVSIGLVGVVWLSAAFVALVQLSWITVEDEESEAQRQRVHLSYAITVLALFLGVPLVTMIYCHLRVFVAIRIYNSKQSKAFELDNGTDALDDQRFDNMSANWKSGVVLAAMLAVFLICWTPYFVLELVVDTEGITALPEWTEYVLFYYTRFIASAINPALFVIGKRDFRQALCGCFSCCRTKEEDKVKETRGTVHSLV